MSKEFEQAYKDYCEGKVEDPAELLRVMWKENKEAIDTFIAKGGFYTKTQRTWVGLTDEEMEEVRKQAVDLFVQEVKTTGKGRNEPIKFGRLVEAKLKEKNND